MISMVEEHLMAIATIILQGHTSKHHEVCIFAGICTVTWLLLRKLSMQLITIDLMTLQTSHLELFRRCCNESIILLKSNQRLLKFPRDFLPHVNNLCDTCCRRMM